MSFLSVQKLHIKVPEVRFELGTSAFNKETRSLLHPPVVVTELKYQNIYIYSLTNWPLNSTCQENILNSPPVELSNTTRRSSKRWAMINGGKEKNIKLNVTIEVDMEHGKMEVKNKEAWNKYALQPRKCHDSSKLELLRLRNPHVVWALK